MAHVATASLALLLIGSAFAANVPTQVDEDTCHTSDEWCHGKRRSAETLLQANKMKMAMKKMAAPEDGNLALSSARSHEEPLLLPPRRVPRRTLVISKDANQKPLLAETGQPLKTCVPVGIETMSGPPGRKEACRNELQCDVPATIGQNVGAYNGDLEAIFEKDLEWPATVTEVFSPWPENTSAVVIGVMVGHSHGSGTLLGTTIIRRTPGVPYDPEETFKITFEATAAGDLVVTFPPGPFTGDTMTFARDLWLLEFPCTDETPTTTTTTTTEPSNVCPQGAKFDFDKAKVPENNLGGLGPEFGQSSRGIRYKGLVEQNGQAIDLVITNNTAYTRKGGTGKSGLFGGIGVKAGTSVELDFSFEDSATGESVVLDLLHLTFLDIDGLKNPRTVEEVYVDDVSGYLIDEASEISVDQDENGRIAFKATNFGWFKDNPTDPMALNELQRQRSAMVVIEGKSSVTVKLGISCTQPENCGDGGATFFFGGDTSLSAKCAE